jgi:hypothetical protein
MKVKAGRGEQDEGQLVFQRGLTEFTMTKLAIVIHIILATVIMGVLIIAILAMPSLRGQEKVLIPAAVALGFLVSIPLSAVLSKKLLALTKGA